MMSTRGAILLWMEQVTLGEDIGAAFLLERRRPAPRTAPGSSSIRWWHMMPISMACLDFGPDGNPFTGGRFPRREMSLPELQPGQAP